MISNYLWAHDVDIFIYLNYCIFYQNIKYSPSIFVAH